MKNFSPSLVMLADPHIELARAKRVDVWRSTQWLPSQQLSIHIQLFVLIHISDLELQPLLQFLWFDHRLHFSMCWNMSMQVCYCATVPHAFLPLSLHRIIHLSFAYVKNKLMSIFTDLYCSSACDTVLMLRFKIYDKMATIVSIILSHFAIATEFERN